MSDFDLEIPGHHDFEVVRTDDKFGGFEILKHKDESIGTNTQFFRKAITPCHHGDCDHLQELQDHLLADNPFATVYPVYTHEDRKWIVISVTKDDDVE